MEGMLQDLRYAGRTLRKSPGFTAVAVLTLALGIGANTTIFSAANAFLLRPMDAAAPDEIVRIYRGQHSPLQYEQFSFLRENSLSFSGLFAQDLARLALNSEAGNEAIAAELVSGNYFTVLEVGAALGRVFTAAADSVAGGSSVVVLSHRFWLRRFGGDPSLIGQSIRLNGGEYTVVGVAREGFNGAFLGFTPDLWAPIAAVESLLGVRLEGWDSSVYVYGRLRPGIDRAEAQAEARILAAELTRADPARREPLELRIDHARGLNAEVRGVAWGVAGGLLVVVGLVLLIACANLANLLLARATTRRREIGVRLALGAGRGRLIRQLLAESVLLALLGGAVALLLSLWTTGLLLRFLPPAELVVDLSPDHRVLLFALAAALGAGILCGLAPAMRASSLDLVGAIKDEATGYRPSRLRSAFVAFQLTLSVLLISSAALFLRSLANAHNLDPGFRADSVLDLSLDLGLAQYEEAQGRELYRRIVETAEALPGVRSATLARVVPLSGMNMEVGFLLEGDTGEEARRMTYFNSIGPRYFETLEIPLLKGREFSWSDAENAPGVAVVNEALVRRHWPNGDALGRRISLEGPGGPFLTVIGIVRDAKYVTLGEEPRPTLYRPISQSYSGEMTLHVRAVGDPDALREPLRASLAALDARLPLPAVKRMTDDMALSLLPTRFAATLLTLFGGLALLLAAVGIYGVFSFVVAQRKREIGIRSALGASRSALLRLVLGESMRLVGVGLSLGLGLASLLARAAAGLLYGVGPLDPFMLLGTPLLLAAVALLASYLPARRAARVDPMIALRFE